MRTVLVVDDDPLIIRVLIRKILANCQQISHIISTTSILQAQQLFLANKTNIELISLDGYITRNLADTIGLVRFMRESGFEKPIIVTSSDVAAADRLINSGCNYTVAKPNIAPLTGLINQLTL